MSKNKQSAWIDANIVLRFLLRDDDKYFESVSALFQQAEDGEISLNIHILTIAEVVWTLESYYEHSKEEISRTLEDFIEAQGIDTDDKEIVKDAFLSYREKNVDFIDAYLASFAASRGSELIYTLDRKHFSRLEGNIRIL